jgi:hypothetical protein
LDFLLDIVGINLIRLISMAIQIMNQLELVKAKSDLVNITIIIRKEEGMRKIIKTRLS